LCDALPILRFGTHGGIATYLAKRLVIAVRDGEYGKHRHNSTTSQQDERVVAAIAAARITGIRHSADLIT
jgi:hypothetical protein